MKLTGLHLLLTYQCTFECDHCFVFSGPDRSGTLTLGQIDDILNQATDLGTVEWIYFEGGEAFLYYGTLLEAARRASRLNFKVGIVSNGYWATDREDAETWLRPFVGLVEDFTVSRDAYHGNNEGSREIGNAIAAAEGLGIPVEVISIVDPETANAAAACGQLPPGESTIMYRGRAAEKLAHRATRQPWERFTSCPYENLRAPGRVHVDPYGEVHICQGISLGNLFREPLSAICASYDPDSHPVTGPLLQGGPAELVRRAGVPHGESYADACHLCFETRRSLRDRFPEILVPDQMYGVSPLSARGDAVHGSDGSKSPGGSVP